MAVTFGMDKKDLPGDGVVTGTGTIFGAPVCIYAQGLYGCRWFTGFATCS